MDPIKKFLGKTRTLTAKDINENKIMFKSEEALVPLTKEQLAKYDRSVNEDAEVKSIQEYLFDVKSSISQLRDLLKTIKADSDDMRSDVVQDTVGFLYKAEGNIEAAYDRLGKLK